MARRVGLRPEGILIGTLAACLLVFVPGGQMDLFYLPKEAVLGLGSLVCGTWVLAEHTGQREPLLSNPVDLLTCAVGMFVLWALMSAATTSADYWLASRPMGLLSQSALLFIAAGKLASSGHRARVLRAIAVLAAVCGIAGMLQVLELVPNVSPPGQAPGGTLGGRNHLAYLLALSAPLLIWWQFTSASAVERSVACVAVLSAAAMVVVARSRAAWVATAVVAVVAIVLVATGRVRFRTCPGIFVLITTVVGGGLGLLLAPKVWGDRGAIADSARRALDFSDGSGRGRVLQAQNSG